MLFSGARGSFLALSDAGHARGPPVHHGASLGPGRAPWRVLWAFKSRNLANNHGVVFRGARAEEDNGKPTCPLFCSTAVKAIYVVAITVQEQAHIKLVWTTTMRVWTLHMRVCSVCAMIVCE